MEKGILTPEVCIFLQKELGKYLSLKSLIFKEAPSKPLISPFQGAIEKDKEKEKDKDKEESVRETKKITNGRRKK